MVEAVLSFPVVVFPLGAGNPRYAKRHKKAVKPGQREGFGFSKIR